MLPSHHHHQHHHRTSKSWTIEHFEECCEACSPPPGKQMTRCSINQCRPALMGFQSLEFENSNCVPYLWVYDSFTLFRKKFEVANDQWPISLCTLYPFWHRQKNSVVESDLFHGNIFRWLQRPLTCCPPFPHGDPQSILAWDIILRKFHHFCVISMAWWLNGYRKLMTKIISKDLLPVPDLFPSTQVEFDTIPVGPLVDLCCKSNYIIDSMKVSIILTVWLEFYQVGPLVDLCLGLYRRYD